MHEHRQQGGPPLRIPGALGQGVEQHLKVFGLPGREHAFLGLAHAGNPALRQRLGHRRRLLVLVHEHGEIPWSQRSPADPGA